MANLLVLEHFAAMTGSPRGSAGVRDATFVHSGGGVGSPSTDGAKSQYE